MNFVCVDFRLEFTTGNVCAQILFLKGFKRRMYQEV